MIANRPFHTPLLLILAASVPLASCVSGGPSDDSGSQPRSATFRCEAEGSLKIQNKGTSVTVVSPRGVEVTLPASPPGSRARYSAPPYALVLDGREALWFVTGKAPLACKR